MLASTNNNHMSKYTEIFEVLKRLVARGFTIDKVIVDGAYDEGEEGTPNIYAKDAEITPLIAYNLVNECDEGSVYVMNPEGKRRWLYFVLGNEPGVALSDYTCDGDIDIVSEEVYELYNRPDAVDNLVELQMEVEKCKAKIISETECFTTESSLFEMICILISQRDNARSVAETLNANLQPEDRRF